MALQAKKDHDVVELLAETTTVAGAIALTYGDAVRLPGMVNGFAFVLDVTAAATDTVDTLNVKIQTKLDGTNWVDVCSFTEVLGDGGAMKHVAKIEVATAQAMFKDAALAAGSVRHLFGDEWRVGYAQVDADSDASFTFTVTACPM